MDTKQAYLNNLIDILIERFSLEGLTFLAFKLDIKELDDFLASKFIIQQEVPYFLRRREQGELIVFPIIIKDCFWDIIDWLKAIQVRPKDGKPLAEFEEAQRDKVIKEIVREIYSLLATSN
jgi:hypothetical protein